jgi:hypothetical protein
MPRDYSTTPNWATWPPVADVAGSSSGAQSGSSRVYSITGGRVVPRHQCFRFHPRLELAGLGNRKGEFVALLWGEASEQPGEWNDNLAC